MLYSFIPPILIVLSLVGIIIFLAKNKDKVAKVSIEEILHEEEERRLNMQEAGFFKKIGLKIKNIRWDDVKHFLLGMMERGTRRSRVFFLKLESKSNDLSMKIRDKRKERSEKKAMLRKMTESSNSDAVIQKLKEYKPEKKKFISFRKREEKKPLAGQEEFSEEETPKIVIQETVVETPRTTVVIEEEKIIRPIISDKIVQPKKAEIKDRLEELLIERIAVNPKDIEAYERLGQYYMEIKSHSDAKECFRQVIRLDPGNRNAKYKLKRLETLLG